MLYISLYRASPELRQQLPLCTLIQRFSPRQAVHVPSACSSRALILCTGMCNLYKCYRRAYCILLVQDGKDEAASEIWTSLCDDGACWQKTRWSLWLFSWVHGSPFVLVGLFIRRISEDLLGLVTAHLIDHAGHLAVLVAHDEVRVISVLALDGRLVLRDLEQQVDRRRQQRAHKRRRVVDPSRTVKLARHDIWTKRSGWRGTSSALVAVAAALRTKLTWVQTSTSEASRKHLRDEQGETD